MYLLVGVQYRDVRYWNMLPSKSHVLCLSKVKHKTSKFITTGHHNAHVGLSKNEFDTPVIR